MSPVSTAAATVPRRAPAAPPLARTSAPLRLVPQPRVRPAKAPFVALVLTLLATGLLGLLMLNTLLAQDAFVLHALEKRTAELADQEQALQQEVAALAAPGALARAARSYGFVPSEPRARLDVANARIIGTPKAAVAPAKPAAQKPAAQKPAAKKPVAKKPAAQKPTTKKPTTKKPTTKKPATPTRVRGR